MLSAPPGSPKVMVRLAAGAVNCTVSAKEAPAWVTLKPGVLERVMMSEVFLAIVTSLVLALLRQTTQGSEEAQRKTPVEAGLLAADVKELAVTLDVPVPKTAWPVELTLNTLLPLESNTSKISTLPEVGCLTTSPMAVGAVAWICCVTLGARTTVPLVFG